MLLSILPIAIMLGASITVDDDGPADFDNLQKAINSATAGDTILISPGTYEDFTLDKNVHLVGIAPGGLSSSPSDNPVIEGSSSSEAHATLKGVTNVTIKGLYFDGTLLVRGLSSGVRIDACGGIGLELNDSFDILVSRCSFGEIWETGPVVGLVVENSDVQVVASDFLGSQGDCELGTNGGAALKSRGINNIRLIQTTLDGGDVWDDCGPWIPVPNYGSQISVESGHLEVILRGDDTIFLWWVEQSAGATIDLSWSGITSSGGTYVHSIPLPAQTLPIEPFLLCGPTIAAPGTRRLSMYGAPGALGLVLFGLGASPMAIPGIDGELIHLDLNSIVATVPMTLHGHQIASTHLFSPPNSPLLAGVTFEVQGVVVEPGFNPFVTNSIPLVLEF